MSAAANLVQSKGSALPSLEKARALLTQCRSVQEVMKIKAIAQAVASCHAAEQAGHEAQAIVLLATARVGELTKELEDTRKTSRQFAAPTGKLTKRENLAKHGLDSQAASVAERVRSLQQSGDLDRYISREAKAGRSPTIGSALELHRLPPDSRKSVLGKLGDKADIKAAVAQIKLEKKHALAAQLRAEPLPLVEGPFRVIVADPPWRYEKRAEDVSHRGRNPYPDMTTEEICALPIGALAHDDAVLWLWTTNAFMRDAFRVIDAWGFKERTILTWVKDRMGTGDWLRGKSEHCLLAVRGKPVVTLTNQTTVLPAPLREHSRKPDEFFALVDALCPGTKVELFAREPREGWAAWGAEKEKFVAAE